MQKAQDASWQRWRRRRKGRTGSRRRLCTGVAAALPTSPAPVGEESAMKTRTLPSCARSRSLVAFLALLTGLVIPGVARADDFQYDGANYSFQITGVPDLDQKRAFSQRGPVFGLPNDGKMYC